MNSIPPKVLLRGTLDRIIRAFAPERIVLFGSYAKGTAESGSDLDLLVIADIEGDAVLHLRRARQLVAASFPPVDVVLCTPEDVSEAPSAKSPFLLSVLGSGITVYSRS
jgi:predicted nucleotidyltransferase